MPRLHFTHPKLGNKTVATLKDINYRHCVQHQYDNQCTTKKQGQMFKKRQ